MIKLRWHSKYEPEKVHQIRELFLREVRYETNLHGCFLTLFKLKPYHSNTPPTPARTRPNTHHPHPQDWAAELLGFDFLPQATRNRTLEAEVDAYLLDNEIGPSTLGYWEVGI